MSDAFRFFPLTEMNPKRHNIEQLWGEAYERFGLVDQAIRSSFALVRELPPIRLIRVCDPQITAQISRYESYVLVEVNDRFLETLLTSIEQFDDQQLVAMLAAPTQKSTLATNANNVRTAIYSIAQQFIFHHELFHVLCGHLDEQRTSSKGRQLFMSETVLAANIAGEQVDESRSAIRRKRQELSMFVELEADDSAMECLVEKYAFGDLAAMFPSSALHVLPISQMTGNERIVGFRLLFAAIWQVIVLLEGLRNPAIAPQTHPYPATRLLSLLFTLMPYYVGSPPVREDKFGQRFARLTEETAHLTREYMVEVVKPAMKFVLSQVSGDEVIFQYESTDRSQSDLFADILLDLKGLLLIGDVTTPSGQQLLSLLKRRSYYVERFRSFRYI